MSPTATIDLGELPPPGRPRIEAGWPGPRFLRRMSRGQRRALATTVVGLATLASTPAAAPLAEPPVSFSFEVTGELTGLDRQRAYRVERVDQPGAGGLVTAYDLDSGAVAWQLPPDSPGDTQLIRDGDLLLSVGFGEPSAAAPRFEVTRLDPETGVPIWTSSGAPMLPVPAGGPLLTVQPTRAVTDVSDRLGVHHQQVAAIDVDTGEPLWRRETIALSTAVDPVARRLLVWEPRGRLTGYDLATGEPVGSVGVAWPDPDRAPDPQPAWDAVVHATAGVIVLAHRTGLAHRAGDEWLLAAYRTTDLRLRWTRRLSRIAGIGPLLSACGDLLCHGHADGDREVPLNPANGSDIWWSEAALDLAPAPVYRAPAHPDLAGYLWLVDEVSEAGWLVDTATGQPVLDLAGWRLPRIADPDAPPLLLKPPGRPPFGPVGAPGYLVGVLRDDPPRIAPLGALSPEYTHCDLHGRFVLCAPTDGGDGTAVWRVRW